MPADKSLAKEAETAGSLSAVTKSEGTAVARTEKIESSLLGSARFDVRDALQRYKAPSNGKKRGLVAYSWETRELSCAIAVAAKAAARKALNCILDRWG